jgi:hypothetical protein
MTKLRTWPVFSYFSARLSLSEERADRTARHCVLDVIDPCSKRRVKRMMESSALLRQEHALAIGANAPFRTQFQRQNVMLRVNRTDSGSTGLKWTS